MKKYYIGLAVLMAIALGSLIYTLSQAGSAKIDAATDKAVDNISTKLDMSVASKGTTPEKLSDVGIKDVPKSITYTKLSDSQYKICINYRTASSGFDASWFSLLGGISSASQDDTYDTTKDYFDSSVKYKHKKGQNCQTVKPYSYSTFNNSEAPQSTGRSAASSSCASAPSNYGVSGYLKVSNVNSTSKQINFDASGQYFTDPNGSEVKANVSSLNYNDSTIFCDSSGNKTEVSAVKSDQSVNVYLSSIANKTMSRLDIFY